MESRHQIPTGVLVAGRQGPDFFTMRIKTIQMSPICPGCGCLMLLLKQKEENSEFVQCSNLTCSWHKRVFRRPHQYTELEEMAPGEMTSPAGPPTEDKAATMTKGEAKQMQDELENLESYDDPPF